MIIQLLRRGHGDFQREDEVAPPCCSSLSAELWSSPCLSFTLSPSLPRRIPDASSALMTNTSCEQVLLRGVLERRGCDQGHPGVARSQALRAPAEGPIHDGRRQWTDGLFYFHEGREAHGHRRLWVRLPRPTVPFIYIYIMP